MSSNEWIEYYGKNTGTNAENSGFGLLRSIDVYGKCFDARTEALAGALAKTRRGPNPAELAKFREFEAAVNNFMTLALAATDPPAGDQYPEYAALYEKQFRYAFYRSHRVGGQPEQPAPEVPDAIGEAKNEFGLRLDTLPRDKVRELHAAFSRIFDVGPMKDTTKLALYHFATFCHSRPMSPDTSPPPF